MVRYARNEKPIRIKRRGRKSLWADALGAYEKRNRERFNRIRAHYPAKNTSNASKGVMTTITKSVRRKRSVSQVGSQSINKDFVTFTRLELPICYM